MLITVAVRFFEKTKETEHSDGTVGSGMRANLVVAAGLLLFKLFPTATTGSLPSGRAWNIEFRQQQPAALVDIQSVGSAPSDRSTPIPAFEAMTDRPAAMRR